ncbi:hypothetical protein GUJ93_ZPchr0009g1459 [Zizania palustris]|uniref:Uncharacterized protein n=1 Tax=Zizania palustris TaxID=103762 RepID=A0A8J5VIH7_ZIZPA|nr:hypothetical protein GUJ93_ZPchr0009g1459 [Zizania palustris]
MHCRSAVHRALAPGHMTLICVRPPWGPPWKENSSWEAIPWGTPLPWGPPACAALAAATHGEKLLTLMQN